MSTLSYPLRMNRPLFDKISEHCVFKKRALLKTVFAAFDNFVFVKQHNCDGSGGEYLLMFEFTVKLDNPQISNILAHYFPKDIVNEINKYMTTTYYLESIYKFCSCVENSEELVKERFKMKYASNVRQILSDLTVHIDKNEYFEYLMHESNIDLKKM